MPDIRVPGASRQYSFFGRAGERRAAKTQQAIRELTLREMQRNAADPGPTPGQRYREQQQIAEQQAKQRQLQVYHQNAIEWTTLYNNAAGPADREHIRKSFSSWYQALPQEFRGQAQIAQYILKGSPLENQKVKLAELTRTNPPGPSPSPEMLETNPRGAAVMEYNRRSTMASNYKQAYGVDNPPPRVFSVGPEHWAVFDEKGNPTMYTNEEFEAHGDVIAKEMGTSWALLKANGFWSPPEIATVTVGDSVMSVAHSYNVFTHETKYSKEVMGPKPASGSDRPGLSTKITDPPKQITDILRVMELGEVAPNEEGTALQQHLDQIKDIQTQVGGMTEMQISDTETIPIDSDEKRQEAYELALNDYLGQFYRNWTFTINEGGTETGRGGFLWKDKKVKQKEGFRIRAIPGQKKYWKTKDGSLLPVVVDEDENAVYDLDGKFRGTIPQVQTLFGTMTLKQLMELD